MWSSASVREARHCLSEDVDSITHCKRKIFVLKITLINHNTHINMSSFPSTRSAYLTRRQTQSVHANGVVAQALPNYRGFCKAVVWALLQELNASLWP